MSTTKVTDSVRDTTVVDAAKITTGTIPEARITSLDSTKLTGTVAEARLGTLDATKLTGNIANARIPASAVTQHVTATDTSKIENDIALLALHQAVNENKSAYSLGNAWIEQFENSTYVTAVTTCAWDAGEFMSSAVEGGIDTYTKVMLHMDDTGLTDSSSSPLTVSKIGNVTRTNTEAKFGTYSAYFDGSGDGLDIAAGSNVNFGNGDWTIDTWWRANNVTAQMAIFAGGTDNTRMAWRLLDDQNNNQMVAYVGGIWAIHQGTKTDFADSTWYHSALTRHGDVVYQYHNGVTDMNFAMTAAPNTENNTIRIGRWGGGQFNFAGNMDEYRISVGISRYPSGTTFTPKTSAYTASVTNATGNFTSTTIAPQDGAAKTSVGLVLLYKNNSGTNTLNTDIICRVSANNGTNYTACVLAAKGTFSTGILIAVAPAVTVTSGTQLKYKVEFANQASGSKEARVQGIAMTY